MEDRILASHTLLDREVREKGRERERKGGGRGRERESKRKRESKVWDE